MSTAAGAVERLGVDENRRYEPVMYVGNNLGCTRRRHYSIIHPLSPLPIVARMEEIQVQNVHCMLLYIDSVYWRLIGTKLRDVTVFRLPSRQVPWAPLCKDPYFPACLAMHPSAFSHSPTAHHPLPRLRYRLSEINSP